jgi:acyl-homoserine lactone acylase PvdQ
MRPPFSSLILLTSLLASVAGAQPADAGYWNDVTLYRDTYGVPHVYAQTPEAMAFAFGYAQAADHLEPMLLAYRMANGRLAEVTGPPDADSDAFALKMAHGALARNALDAADPITQALCTGFAQGVNAWMAANTDTLPEWADGVHPADILALWHCFLTRFAPFDLDDRYRPDRPFETGAAWAASAAKTREGKPLLVINPHGYFDGPFRWYEAHLAVGDYDVSGATLFGLPVLLVGHNGDAGWAITPNRPDFADFFEERVIPGKQTSPWWRLNRENPEAEALEKQRTLMLNYAASVQTYTVRTPNGFETREIPVQVSPLGPVFDQGIGALFSWGIGGYFDFGGLLQLFEMGRARDFDAFGAALAAQQLPCFNVLYADRADTQFQLYNAKIGQKLLHDPNTPVEQIQDPPVDWNAPIPAAITVWDWAGPVPQSALPHVLNPATGWLQIGGGPPWLATDDIATGAGDWPAWFVQDPVSPRAERLRTVLRGAPRTFEDHQQLLFDVVVPAAERLAPQLLAMADAAAEAVAKAHPDLPEALNLLRAWNHTAAPEAEGMTFYHVWWASLRARAQAAGVPEAGLYAALFEDTPEARRLALDAASDAVRMMRNDLRSLKRLWGDVHRIRRGPRDEAIGGAATGDPIFLVSDFAFQDGRWYATYGYGYALVVQFGDTTRATSLVPFGASERPSSPHFSDQLDLLLAQRMKTAPYHLDDILRDATAAHGARMTFHPRGSEAVLSVEFSEPAHVDTGASLVPPAPLPPRMAPFSAFLRLTWKPGITGTAEAAIHLPEARCPEEALPHLAVYAMEEGLGWYRVAAQRYDPQARSIMMQNDAPATYAVLGPDQYAPQPKDAEAAPLPEPEPVLPAEPMVAPESVPVETPSETPAPEATDLAPVTVAPPAEVPNP